MFFKRLPSNTYFDFSLNIRNKQSGVYPSHIMLDYTTKDAIGKTPIDNNSNPDEFQLNSIHPKVNLFRPNTSFNA